MHDNPLLHHVLWSVQGFLALFFMFAGAPKILGRGIDRWTGFTGIAELLGAAGLVLPMATGIAPWLTPLAAVGLALIVLMAAGFHLRADERLEALETSLWASIAAVIAIGRWDLVSAHLTRPPTLLVGALAILVPAAVINVVILVRRPPRVTPPRAAVPAPRAHDLRSAPRRAI